MVRFMVEAGLSFPFLHFHLSFLGFDVHFISTATKCDSLAITEMQPWSWILDLQVRGRQCSDRGEYTQPYGRVTQAAWAARGGCVAELLPLVSTKTVLLQWRCYGRHHLSTWILPLIMINNHDDVIFREREMEKYCHSPVDFFSNL